jgi:predicted metal-dependent hydrolase
VPDDLELDSVQTVALARELWQAGRPFAAHEVFEAAWKRAGDPASRLLWRGLAQLMVAVTHAMRGNQAGAQALFSRSDETLAALPDLPEVDLVEWRQLTDPWRVGASDGAPPDEGPGPGVVGASGGSGAG